MKNNNKKEIKNLIDFYKKAEKLKTTTRHSWLSDSGRQESVAEHSWMLCLLAMLLSDELDKKVNLLKVMKMVTIHDLAEAVTGDIPVHEVSSRQKNKHKAEEKAFKKLVVGLPKEKASEIMRLWEEMEKKETLEAKFAQSLDKLEVVMQHNVADISTWDQNDYNASPYYKEEYFNFDPFMKFLREIISIEGMNKVLKAKTKHHLDPKHLERFKKEKHHAKKL
jgi:putative hydrolase of HD superfamily